MQQLLKGRFGKVFIGVVMGFIVLVFVVTGVFYSDSYQLSGGGQIVGTVDGQNITSQEFQRALDQRMEYFKQLSGGSVPEALMGRIREGVFEELVSRKLQMMQAEKIGRVASDAEVREQIKQFPAFQKDGQFDAIQYKNVLRANQYSPTTFEDRMREDLTVQSWSEFVRNRVKVTEDELKQEFVVSNTKRKLKFILLTANAGKKMISVSDAEANAFLEKKENLEKAKNEFETKKNEDYKGKTFEDVKVQIAKNLVAGEDASRVLQENQKLADQVMPLFGPSKASEQKVNDTLKKVGVKVQETGWVSALDRYVPGIGEQKELFSDLFAAKSPLNPSSGGGVKKYVSGSWVILAVMTDQQNPNMKEFDKEKTKIKDQLSFRKQRILNSDWMKTLTEAARIKRNDKFLGAPQEG